MLQKLILSTLLLTASTCAVHLQGCRSHVTILQYRNEMSLTGFVYSWHSIGLRNRTDVECKLVSLMSAAPVIRGEVYAV